MRYVATNFISSKDVGEKRVIHSNSNNLKLMSYNNANEVADETFESLLSRYEMV